MEYFGNKEILKLDKTAFLCSQRCPANVILKSYDWAKSQREEGVCVACGNHSQIEKDVFNILLKGEQPLILILARGMNSLWDPEINKALADNRLLILSPFEQGVKRITRATARVRNRFLIDLCDHIVVAYTTQGGQLDLLLTGHQCKHL